MDWADLERMVERRIGGAAVDVELYTRAAVRSGQVTCPPGARLSDLLNDAARGDGPAPAAFLDFQPAYGGGNREFVRKSAIDLVAVADAAAGKVTAVVSGEAVGPHREKSPARISLDVGSYTLTGDMHCAPGETVEDVLNADAPFLPLTSVIMVRDNLLYGNRPFIAVNKREVISCREESPG
jgi:hypothetical protein